MEGLGSLPLWDLRDLSSSVGPGHLRSNDGYRGLELVKGSIRGGSPLGS